MKSFLGFLKESSSLIEEGVFIGEEVPVGKYTATKQNKVSQNIKHGYYLYFVEYKSLTSPNANNIYFGIKHKPGLEGNPDLFWGSLRTLASGGNKITRKEYWTDYVIDCDGNKCSSDTTVKPSKIYMSSSSNKNRESLPNTFFVGITKDKKYHPWIMNTSTLNYVKKAAGKEDSEINILPIDKNRNKKIPSPTEYAYKVYVIDDMTTLNNTIETVLKNPTSKLPTDVRDFFKEMKDMGNELLDMLVKMAADDVINKYFKLIEEFYADNTQYKKPKEFLSEEKYKNFLNDSIKNNPWTLVGTFEALGTQMMYSLIKGEKGSNSYDYLKKQVLQVKSTELSLSLHDTNKNLIPAVGDVYFPKSLDTDTRIEIAAFMKGIKAEKMKADNKIKRKREEAEAARKVAEEGMKQLLFGGFISPLLPKLYKAINDNDNKSLAELKKFFIEVELPALYSLEYKNAKLANLFPTIPPDTERTGNLILLKSPSPKNAGEVKTWNTKIEKIEAVSPVKALDNGMTFAEIERRRFHLGDFIHLIFNKNLIVLI